MCNKQSFRWTGLKHASSEYLAQIIAESDRSDQRAAENDAKFQELCAREKVHPVDAALQCLEAEDDGW